jgi:hypothetical protein
MLPIFFLLLVLLTLLLPLISLPKVIFLGEFLPIF